MLEGIKIAVLDYDRALFSHPYPERGEGRLSFEEEAFLELTQNAIRHEKDFPLEVMMNFVTYLKNNGVVCCVLTAANTNLRTEIKKNTSERFYGITKYYEVNKAENKVPFIKALVRAEKIRLDECLLVDDNMDTIYSASIAGISTLPLSSVITFMDKLNSISGGTGIERR